MKKFVNAIMWMVGILVTLSIAFAMTAGTLTIPFLPSILVVSAGWILIVLTAMGVIGNMVD